MPAVVSTCAAVCGASVRLSGCAALVSPWPPQEAAGMFAHVKENEASKIDNPRPIDLSPECLSMMEKLMLAQAQVNLQGNGFRA